MVLFSVTGLCYAEFGARVPRAGSAYIYSYVTMGEFTAFLIGWTLILEYVIGSASVVRGLSSYVDKLFDNAMKHMFQSAAHINVNYLSSYPNFFAFEVTLISSGRKLLDEILHGEMKLTCFSIAIFAWWFAFCNHS